MLKRPDLTEEFRVWLEDKHGPYDYAHTRECALCQFLKHKHGDEANVVVSNFHYSVDGYNEIIPTPLHAQLMVGNFDRLRELIDGNHLF